MWDEEHDDCHCDCAGCRLHFPVEDERSWRVADTSATDSLDKLACEAVGHRKRVMLGGKWVQCGRCLEHLSGPVPDTWSRYTAFIDDMYRLPGVRARIVDIRDSEITE